MSMEPMPLPPAFLRHTEAIMGTERLARFLEAFCEEPPVSIRLNPQKGMREGLVTEIIETRVPWCADGYYLSRRPNFTFDPLLHAGCYYVQEAASQFVAHCADFIVGNLTSRPSLTALDLCAAPGGKSTALRATLPEDALLVSNEPIRKRAQILSENMQKWGHTNCIVANNYPRDFMRSGLADMFDIVLCDVPCSGEGMFRKDPSAIGEWSEQNVERCWQLQREIVSDIWPCLRPGGVLIYSTCTFNTKENEENVKWLTEQLDAEMISIPTLPDWHVCGSLLPGFCAPVYRFIPGVTRSEGLFVAVLRKKGGDTHSDGKSTAKRFAAMASALSRLNLMHTSFPPVALPGNTPKAKKNKKQQDEEMTCTEALSATLDRSRYNMVELPYDKAIAYLRREAIVLPEDTPRGIVVVTFKGHPLGVAKNIGSRANNLYPHEWAIKSSHTPTLPPYSPAT